MQTTAALMRTLHAPFEIASLRLGEPRDDEVRVKVIAAGICRTDIDVRDGYLPTPGPVVLGHEGAGIVEQVGAGVRGFEPGDHVVMSMGRCGVCEACGTGQPGFCVQHMALNFAGARADGSVALHDHEGCAVHSHFFAQSSHASYAIVHGSSLVKVPKDVDLRLLGPLACGVMTGAGGVFNTLRPERGSSVAIFGAGTVGLSALMAAKIAGCAIRIVVDNKPQRLELARELGATHAVLAAPDVDVAARVREIAAGGVHGAFESSGVKGVIRTALEAVRERGTLVMTGVLPAGSSVEFDAWTLLRGRCVRGSVMGDGLPEVLVPRLVAYYRQGQLPLDKISRLYPLSQINEAVQDSSSGAVVKAIVVMPHGD